MKIEPEWESQIVNLCERFLKTEDREEVFGPISLMTTDKGIATILGMLAFFDMRDSSGFTSKEFRTAAFRRFKNFIVRGSSGPV